MTAPLGLRFLRWWARMPENRAILFGALFSIFTGMVGLAWFHYLVSKYYGNAGLRTNL